ncbi:MAG: DUF1015 family protein [Acutalibacteraceae bacterium]
MAEIKPIQALRYTDKAGKLADNVCPPYDIVSAPEREALVSRSAYNLIRLELPEGGDDRYAQAGALLNEWLETDVLARDEEAGIFIYEEEFDANGGHYVFDGIVCLVKLEPFEKRVVLPHEETLKGQEDRFNLMKSTFCNFSRSIRSIWTTSVKFHPARRLYRRAARAGLYRRRGVTHRL